MFSKVPSLLKTALLFFFLTHYALSAVGSNVDEESSGVILTAELYGAFLNEVASADSDYLFDEKIASQVTGYRSETAGMEQIIRSGEPGCYRYTVSESE